MQVIHLFPYPCLIHDLIYMLVAIDMIVRNFHSIIEVNVIRNYYNHLKSCDSLRCNYYNEQIIKFRDCDKNRLAFRVGFFDLFPTFCVYLLFSQRIGRYFQSFLKSWTVW